MERKTKRLMAYIFTPLIFVIVGYMITAIVLSPFWDVIHAANTLLISSSESSFSVELNSIFDENVVVENEGEIHISEIDIPHYGTHYAEIRSNRIGLLAPVYYGDSYEILRFGVGHNSGSFFPGFGGTILMSAHNTSHFLPLKDIEDGDIVEIQTNYGQFKYEVVDVRVVHSSEALNYFDFGQTDQELLVIYTCYPFGGIVGITPFRLFVFGEKISGPAVDFMARVGDSND